MSSKVHVCLHLMCSCIFIFIINFSPVIVLHSYSPLHHHHRYCVCIFSGLCTKIVTSNVNVFNELAVHHDCVSFPYYLLHTFSWTLGKRIQYTELLFCYISNDNFTKLKYSRSISLDFYNFLHYMRTSYNTCVCNGISDTKNFYI